MSAITLADLKTFVAGRLARDNLIIGVAGDITAAELAPLLDQTFGGLPAKSAPFALAEALPARAGTVIVRKDVPQSVGAVRRGRPRPR